MNKIDSEVFKYIYDNLLLVNNITVPDDTANEEDKKAYSNLSKILEYYINKICTDIIIMTNRNNFPNDLKDVVVSLASDAYELYKSSSNAGTTQNIQSMSEDGRSVSFGSAEEWKTKYNTLIATQLAQNEKIINRYRLLYKVRCPYAKN